MWSEGEFTSRNVYKGPEPSQIWHTYSNSILYKSVVTRCEKDTSWNILYTRNLYYEYLKPVFSKNILCEFRILEHKLKPDF